MRGVPSEHALSVKGIMGLRMTMLPNEVAAYFPYSSVRPFQDQFIKTVFDAVEERRSVLIEGSNGLGKTISALSACLPAAVEKDLKILYVARTHRQHDRVIEELKAIFKKQPVSGISLRGRHEMCLNDFAARHTFDAKSLMEVCELLKAKDKCPFYKNMEEQTDEFLQVQQQITSRPHKASEIQKICRKKGLCPYELVKASLPDVNVIALSYLYVLKQAEFEAKKFDHADIGSFARLMRNEIENMTAGISKEALIAPEFIIEIIKKQGSISNPRDFFENIHDVGNLIKRSLLAEGKSPRSYIHGMSEFLLKWLETLGDESFINVASKYVSRENVVTAKLEIVALDPSKVTAPVFSSVYSSTVMSGTLQPLEAYAKITKLPENTVKSIVPSPFPKEHVLSIVCLGVTSAMQKRTPTMYRTIIKRINEVVKNTPANTGIFAASFGVLNALKAEGLEKTLNKPLFSERRGMSSKANEKMVAAFKAYAESDGAVLLGVQGGRSSEGVDFPGNQMNSVIVVGVPYAEPTPRVNAQVEYYEKCFPKLGREYGYVLPAMKKASQAAGRPIRTLEDRGVIVFLDFRFATSYCRSFLPSWINNGLKVLPDQDGTLTEEVRGFFKP
jgi:DNA excision repair protein ERCC-2